MRHARDIWESTEFMAWFSARPPDVQAIICTHPPHQWYQVQNGPYAAQIKSYDEHADAPVTLTCTIYAVAPREVFGLAPTDVVPCQAEEIANHVWLARG